MRIALLGATGTIGSLVLAEALARGHAVTALARDAEVLPLGTGAVPRTVDLVHDDVAHLVAGHDALGVAVRFVSLSAVRLLEIARAAAVWRAVIAGSAGMFAENAGQAGPGATGFSARERADALAGRDFIGGLATARRLAWTVLAPASGLSDGPRTGHFGYTVATGLAPSCRTSLSARDYAAAFVDELEAGHFVRQSVWVVPEPHTLSRGVRS